MALEKLFFKKRGINNANAFPYHATIVWGLIMWIWSYDQSLLQSSLRSSMKYLYKDIDINDDDATITTLNDTSIKDMDT